MESSCEQILKWTEKVLNGGAITEEEARTLIRTAGIMRWGIRLPPSHLSPAFCGIVQGSDWIGVFLKENGEANHG